MTSLTCNGTLKTFILVTKKKILSFFNLEKCVKGTVIGDFKLTSIKKEGHAQFTNLMKFNASEY